MFYPPSDACKLTLDPNTAHNNLTLSEGNRVLERCPNVKHSYPDHPDRFDSYGQVLCREAVSKHCYWEVEWSGNVDIAVSYNGLTRKGGAKDCGLGCNNKSWSLNCSSSSYTFIHENKQMSLPHEPTSTSRIGVYVDHETGNLSFCHRFRFSFSYLYPVHCIIHS